MFCAPRDVKVLSNNPRFTKISKLKLFRENSCCLLKESCETHTFCGQTAGLFNVKALNML